jgi:hypothetical protein
MYADIEWHALRAIVDSKNTESPISAAARLAMQRFTRLMQLNSTGTLSWRTLNAELNGLQQRYFAVGFPTLKSCQNWAALVRQGFRAAAGVTRSVTADTWTIMKQQAAAIDAPGGCVAKFAAGCE